MPSRRLLSGALALRLRRLRPLRRATCADAPGRVGVGNPTPLAVSCCSLDARPSQQRFRSRECRCGIPDLERVVSFQRATTPRSWPPTPDTLASTVLPTPEGAGFPVQGMRIHGGSATGADPHPGCTGRRFAKPDVLLRMIRRHRWPRWLRWGISPPTSQNHDAAASIVARRSHIALPAPTSSFTTADGRAQPIVAHPVGHSARCPPGAEKLGCADR